jgi:hypothetical protein
MVIEVVMTFIVCVVEILEKYIDTKDLGIKAGDLKENQINPQINFRHFSSF